MPLIILPMNERFLRGSGTSIALMGIGFVIVKFALFIKQISFCIGKDVTPQGKGYSAVIGVTMVAFGAIITVLAYIRYRTIEKHLNSGAYFPSKWLSLLVAVLHCYRCLPAGSLFVT